jgi:hypothetical protein
LEDDWANAKTEISISSFSKYLRIIKNDENNKNLLNYFVGFSNTNEIWNILGNYLTNIKNIIFIIVSNYKLNIIL